MLEEINIVALPHTADAVSYLIKPSQINEEYRSDVVLYNAVILLHHGQPCSVTMVIAFPHWIENEC